MSGQGVSRRRRRLPSRFRDGAAIARADGRAREVRAIRDGARAIIEDRGGDDAVSFLVRRTATRVMFLDGLLSRDEMAIAEGKEIDRTAYVRNAQVWLKYAVQLGFARVPKPAESLDQFKQRIAARTQQEASVPR